MNNYIDRINFINQLEYNTNLCEKNKMWGDSLHKICSYNAMFAPRVIDFFINKYSKEDDVILDPFSGRGTTLLQSRILKRKAYASDLNPLSMVLTRSKMKNYDKSVVMSRLEEINNIYSNEKHDYICLLNKDEIEELLIYYSESNLNQILFLKNKLGSEWRKLDEIDNFILAITLGLMHGPVKKDNTSSFFSLSMSNGVSMSPNYVKQYAAKHDLKKPEANIFELIAEKIEKVYKTRSRELSKNRRKANFILSDALEISNTWKNLKPDLIITSPPYLNIIDYTRQNWLKMWLLGYQRKDLKKIKLNDNLKESEYLCDFLVPFMNECFKLMKKDNAKLILIIGDVKRGEKIYSILNYMEEIERKTGFYLCEYYSDNIKQTNKATNSLGKKAGKATMNEKIYIFSKFK